jgi:glycosyltransferase involved in cell wall biosynthesis
MLRETQDRLAVLIPVFNDWECVALLIPRLDSALKACASESELVLIDDGSTIPVPENLLRAPLENLRAVRVLHLRRNLGHQRAIAIGLYYVHETIPCRAVVVMDGDGEDRPEDIARLVEALDRTGGREVIFAARMRRMETLVFKTFYHLYRVAHRLLTGVAVRVGNFSIVPHAALSRLMVNSELWNHYAAAVFRSRLTYNMVPLARDRRLSGRSRMNFTALMVHGLSAIAVFSDIVSVRLLIAAAGFGISALLLIAGIAYIRFCTHLAIPGWAGLAIGFLLVICIQAIMLSVLLVFAIVSGRSATSFIPLRDAPYFIQEDTQLLPQP